MEIFVLVKKEVGQCHPGSKWCMKQEMAAQYNNQNQSHHRHNLPHNQAESGVYRVRSDIPGAHLLTSGLTNNWATATPVDFVRTEVPLV